MKLIERNGLLGIDKQEIEASLVAKNFIGLNRLPRSEKIIVSLTSYLPRIHNVKYTIYSLLNQSFPPDKLILWLDEDSFPQREKNLPRDLLELREFGLTIDWCENLRPYKKLIPALEKYPDDIIVTADDDIFYQPDWLKILYDEYLKNPDCVIAHRVHRIRLDKCGDIFPYTSWQLEIKSKVPSYRNFLTSGAGALYKKNFFHTDILKRNLFLELSPSADDIWFWAMIVLNGTKIKIPSAAQKKLIFVDIDTQINGETLWSMNQTQNDIKLSRVMEKYPVLLETLIREDMSTKPYISVVLLMENADSLNETLTNVFAQRFPDFELIVINTGLRVEVSTLPTNFQIINYPGGTESEALNLGLQKAAGEYILFKDTDSSFMLNALEIINQAVNASKADVIHFAGHIADEKFIFDDEIQFNGNTPIFFDELKQTRAALWLQDKLSGRLDTKIFRRKFLTEHKINFDDNIAEFMFEALIYAEKYLIIPQAFCLCKD